MSSSKDVFERRTSTRGDSLILLEASKLLLVSVFTLIETILTEASVKVPAQELQKVDFRLANIAQKRRSMYLNFLKTVHSICFSKCIERRFWAMLANRK